MKFDDFLNSMNESCQELFKGYGADVTDNLYRINYAISKALQMIEEKRQITEIKNNDVYLVEGIEQDKLYSQDLVIRKAESRSKGVWVTTNSTPGTVVKKNELKLKTNSDITFTNTSEFIVETTGNAEVKVECETKGEVGNIGFGELSGIKTPILGIGSGTNLIKFEGGQDLENDYEYRKRYLKFRGTYTGLTKDDIQKEILRVSGVNSVQLVENDTEEEKVLDNGLIMPRKSFIAYVDGGADEDVAKAIYKKHNTSIHQLGDISEEVYSDTRKVYETIKFSRIKDTKIYYKYEILGEGNIVEINKIIKEHLYNLEIGGIISSYLVEKDISYKNNIKLISVEIKFSKTEFGEYSTILRLNTGEKISEVIKIE